MRHFAYYLSSALSFSDNILPEHKTDGRTTRDHKDDDLSTRSTILKSAKDGKEPLRGPQKGSSNEGSQSASPYVLSGGNYG